jgi:putative membrane protein
MMGGFDGFMGTFGGLWMLLPILFWGGLLALIVWAVIRIFPERRSGERSEVRGRSSEEILRERFVRGEVDAEEYERSLGVLRNGRNPLEGGV